MSFKMTTFSSQYMLHLYRKVSFIVDTFCECMVVNDTYLCLFVARSGWLSSIHVICRKQTNKQKSLIIVS